MKIIKNRNFVFQYCLILILLLFFSTSKSIYAQTISINSTFNSSTTVYTFNPSETIYSLTISGSSSLNSDSSMIRVILVDNSNVEHLIYESYPLLHAIGTNALTSYGEETQYMNGVGVGYVKVEVRDANVTINTIDRLTTAISGVAGLKANYQATIIQNKVNAINQILQQKGAIWIAGITTIAQLPYSKQKEIFPLLDDPLWYGYVYYKGGIFDITGGWLYEPSPNVVSDFSWRDRHNENWNTDVRDQGFSGTCVSFGESSTIEAIINLYYNDQTIDINLSEQALVSCGVYNNWDKHWNYIKNTGVPYENDFPYVSVNSFSVPCPANFASLDKWKVTDYSVTLPYAVSNVLIDEEQLKIDIITKGPVDIFHHYPYGSTGHEQSMVGFGVFQEGDAVNWIPYGNPPANQYIGKVYWILKNSWGSGWGGDGYSLMFIDLNATLHFSHFYYTSIVTPIIQPSTSSYIVQCTDNDLDGYFYWGIGDRPAGCGGTNPQDCDDSNPYILGYNSKYECIFDCNNFTYNSTPLNITTNLDIVDAEYTQDIVIKSPAVVRILGKVNMQAQAKIVVEKGAKLIIDGGEITNPCGQFWRGIEVQGDYSNPQNPESNQGVVEIINYGKISMADIAIQTKTAPKCGTPPGQYIGGGIVKIDQAIFKNNRISVFLRSFQNYIMLNGSKKDLPERSYVKNSIFETNDDFPASYTFDKFIFLNGINNVALFGNSYKNTNTSSSIMQNYAYRGTAIDAIESSFRLKPSYTFGLNPTLINSSEMDGLFYGVKVFNTNPNKVVQINETEFNDNYRSIYLNKTYSAVVTENDFYVPNIQTTPSIDQPYGLYLDECQSFKVEENDFYTSDASGNINQTYGILINNTKANNNEIYNNTFDDFYVAIQPELQNKGIINNVSVGLYLLCNSIGNSNNDIRPVGKTSFPNTSNIGIASYHSLSEQFNATTILLYPSGNKFSNRTTGYDFDNSDAEFLEYLHEANTSTERYKPDINNSNMTLTEVVWGNKTRCESKLISNTTLVDDYNSLNIAYTGYYSSKLILDIWLDGGIESLEQDVELTLPWEAYEQFNNLMQESPYLSDEVLIEFINNPVFSSLMVKLLLVANSQSSRSDEVMSAVYDRIPALPESYIQEILAGQDGYSPLDELEGNVASDYHLVQTLSQDIIRIYRMDTVNLWSTDSLIEIMQRQQGLYKQYELATSYLFLGDFEDMNTLLSNIPDNYELNERQQTEYQNTLISFRILKDMEINEKYENGLSENQRDSLMDILENYPYDCSLTLCLLKRDNPDYTYQELILDPITQPARKAKSESVKVENMDVFKIYPNPASDYFTIEYKTSDIKYNQLLLTLQDATGRVVLKKQLQGGNSEELIDLGNLSPGTYNVMLFADNLIIDNNKLTVTEK